MATTIRVTQVEKMNGYYEFDYKHPTAKQRIRRKIEATYSQSELLKNLLEKVLDDNLDFEKTSFLIRTNNFYAPETTYLENAIQLLYFNYFNKNAIPNAMERDEAKNHLLDSLFPLSDYKANFCFLGKAGVGKSTIIQKMSRFWQHSEISFPFTDTSRTSTFPADYCFVTQDANFKFLAVFTPQSVIDLNISECIDRAVNKLLELRTNSPIANQNGNDSIDAVMSAFINDPTQTFDIRYSLGRYIKTTSPAYQKPENSALIDFWQKLFHSFVRITDCVTSANRPIQNIPVTDHSPNNIAFYQLKYSDAIKENDDANAIYQIYIEAFELIQNQIAAVRTNLIEELHANPSITNIVYDIDDELIPFFSCTIQEMNSEAFFQFIRCFTTKKSTEFGRSVFNLVAHLRIELPLSDAVKLPQEGFSFVLQDTIGIAHSNDENGGLENSTHLKMEDVDAVVIIDDARMNGDNNISAILSHLLARIAPQKIFFAFTFFDNLQKADFDDADDLDEQRISYLITTQTNTIRNIVKDQNQSNILLKKLNASDSFYMKGLMESDDFTSINHLIDKLICNKIFLSNCRFFKPEPNEPLVTYDYKKIPLLYQNAIDKYRKQQWDIYITAPPHYKTTEALTRRLSIGETFFSGARTLRPVDDFYDLLIKAFSDYINHPTKTNFTTKNETSPEFILGALRTKITEELGSLSNDRFCKGAIVNEWWRLYCLTGIGSDKIRRQGILSTEEFITPGLDSYLNATVREHMIDAIEEIFVRSIASMED